MSTHEGPGSDAPERSAFGAPRDPEQDKALEDALRAIRDSEREAERSTAGIRLG